MREALPMQPATRFTSERMSGGNSAVATTSEMARRPPGFKTRYASRKTCALSGDRLMTQFDMITSATPSARGRCSISPRRNSTLAKLPFTALERAFDTMSGVMSTPITRPVSPTSRAARKQSKPPPEPRSTTTSPGFSAAIALGLPHPRPMSAPCGTESRSSWL